MSPTNSTGQRRRGDVLEAAILDAGWDQLLDAGYERFTFDAVAERAATARSVLYRRWSSRQELLQAVLHRRGQVDAIATPDTGNLRDDALAVLIEFNARRSRLIGLMAAGLGAYYEEAGESPGEVRKWVLPDGPSIMDTIVERAVARGELAAPLPSYLVELPVTLLRHELLMTLTAAAPETIVTIVDDVFLPLAKNFGQSAPC